LCLGDPVEVEWRVTRVSKSMTVQNSISVAKKISIMKYENETTFHCYCD